MNIGLKVTLQSLTGYGLVGFFSAFVGVVFVVHAGSALNLGFPILAMGLAFFLYFTKRDVFIAFVWWMWLVTPEVRRLVDFQSGYHDISPVMLTPLLVTSLAFIKILQAPSLLLRRELLGHNIAGSVIAFAFIVGSISNGLLPSAYEFATWIIPLGFGVFLMTDLEGYDANRKAMLFSIILGLLLIAAYGIYQFYDFPPWDAFWLSKSNFTSAGVGAAEQVRVFGPLNSPGPYALALMFSLIFVIVDTGPFRILAGGIGFLAFGLTLVRSAWGAWIIAAFYIVSRLGGKARLRFFILATIVIAIVVPLISVGPVAGALSKRFSTLNNIRQDASFQSRVDLYEAFTVQALSEPLGVGFGQIGLATKLTSGQATVLDSGFLETTFEFGWVGSALFFWSIASLVLRTLKRTSRSVDKLAIAATGLVLANVAQDIFGSTFAGLGGMTIWIPIAFALGPLARSSRTRVSSKISDYSRKSANLI